MTTCEKSSEVISEENFTETRSFERDELPHPRTSVLLMLLFVEVDEDDEAAADLVIMNGRMSWVEPYHSNWLGLDANALSQYAADENCEWLDGRGGAAI